MEDKGLDADGFIRREGDPRLIQHEFVRLLQDFIELTPLRLPDAVDSLYAYGSVARGIARPGASDFDAQILLHEEPTERERTRVHELAATLHTAHPEVTDVGLLVHSIHQMVDPADRCDGGFHIRVLCMPVWGPDAGERVRPHEPSLELARRVQGDWRAAVDRLRITAQEVPPGRSVALCRSTGRRLTRLAFTWVMPRWRGWTSDPDVMLDVVTRFEPSWSQSVQDCLDLGWGGRTDPALARELLGGFCDDLTDHGTSLGA